MAHLGAPIPLPASTGRLRRPAGAAVLRGLLAVSCAASAGVHVALVPGHLAEARGLAVAFLATAVALSVLAAATCEPRYDRAAVPAAVALLAATAVAYLLSRRTGIPLLGAHPEPVDVVGVVTTAIEALGVLAGAALAHHHWRSYR